jgi:hypothetical protein
MRSLPDEPFSAEETVHNMADTARRMLEPGEPASVAETTPEPEADIADADIADIDLADTDTGVKSLFGGSKRAGRSVKGTFSLNVPKKEPIRLCHGEGWAGKGEARLPGLRRAKTRCISRC